jgi:hypothetical protein
MALKRKRDALTATTRSLSDLIKLLKTQPLPVAREAIERIRRGVPPEEVIKSIQADPSSAGCPSILAVNRSLLPHTQSKFEFELNVRHANAYPSLRPIANVDFGLIGFTPSPNKALGQIGGQVAPGSLAKWAPPAKVQTIDPTQLFHARSSSLTEKYIDDRLAKVDFGRWTNVPVSNEFAAKVLSLYLEVFHPFLGFFDADLFLDSLISGETRFCSRMMVNALLAWTCVGCPSSSEFPLMGSSQHMRIMNPARLFYPRNSWMKRPCCTKKIA